MSFKLMSLRDKLDLLIKFLFLCIFAYAVMQYSCMVSVKKSYWGCSTKSSWSCSKNKGDSSPLSATSKSNQDSGVDCSKSCCSKAKCSDK